MNQTLTVIVVGILILFDVEALRMDMERRLQEIREEQERLHKVIYEILTSVHNVAEKANHNDAK